MHQALTVHKVSNNRDMETVFAIRRQVFVVEQEVAPEEEFDEFEDESYHFLCHYNDRPAGVARWRFTDKGIKMERFAVLEEFRSKGVGSVLVKAVEDDIAQHANVSSGAKMYMHAQVSAMGLYTKYGYEKKGDLFLECDIEHYLMEKSV